MDPNFPLVSANLPILSNGAGSFPPQSFFFLAITTIFTPMNYRHKIYLAALAGADLDILIRGVDLVSGSHYSQNR